MHIRKKTSYRIFLNILLLVIVALFIPKIFMSNNISSCGEDSEAVAYARSLPKERLRKLYADMKRYSKRSDIPPEGYQLWLEKNKVPKEFTDLKVINVRPDRGYIVVEGCFDHYVLLKFKGIGYISRKNSIKDEIILSWGEYPVDSGSEVLWKNET